MCQADASTSNRWLPENIAVTNTNFSPRLSLAWDPWSNGKTKFSVSAGRYYNNIPLTIPMQEQSPTTGDVELICLNDNCQPSGTGNTTPTISIVDRGIKTPYQDEWTVSFERELFAETLLRVTYINREYRDQIQDIDINHQPGDFGRCQLQNSPGQAVVVPITDPNDPLYGQFPNGGDGIIDDCQGKLLTPETNPEAGDPPLGSGLASFLQRPDGLPDLYIQNPFFGQMFLIGNFNESDYEGVTLELIRRQYQGWEMQGSYTYAESVGNGEDFFQNIGDDISLLDDEVGYQSTDRRHVVKLNATTITPWGFRFGTSVSWESGLPFSILQDQVARDAVPPVSVLGDPAARRRLIYPTGERNDQRNLSYWNVNIKFTKEMRVGQRANLQLSAEIFNLLNDDTYQVYNQATEIGQQLNGINDGFYRQGRQFQFGAKVTF